MRFETWNKISPRDQQVILELSPWAEANEAKTQQANEAFAYKRCADLGVEVIDLTPAELANWQSVARPIEEQWVKDVEAKGFPAREVYNDIKRMVGK